jgi:hypothetical protein
MRTATRLLAGLTLLLGSDGVVWAQEGTHSGAPAPFGVASIRFEQNATDGDAEVVVEVKGGEDGLSKLTVLAPNGRTVLSFAAPDATTLGMRQFLFESPEPKDIKSLKSAYPEGVYVFDGTTAHGARLHSSAALSHKLPAPVSFLQPKGGAENVPVRNLVVTWTPVNGLAGYLVYLEQSDVNETITVRLPATATNFAVPAGFLRPGTAYQLGIGTVADQGNVSFVETTITTAHKP